MYFLWYNKKRKFLTYTIMQESEYLDVRVNKKTRLPLLFKEIFSTRKKNIRLIIEEPLDWMRNETQMRFLKHKIEEQGKKIVIVTDDPEVRAVAQNASIQVQINALSSEQQTSNMLEISKDKQVVKKQPTASASVVISKKDKSEPAKDRVVIKSEYELSEKDATGKFSFFPKKGRSHTFTVKKQFASGLLTKIFRKPGQTSKNTDTPTSEKLKTSIIALLPKEKTNNHNFGNHTRVCSYYIFCDQCFASRNNSHNSIHSRKIH